jgi:hypothetical protein
MKTERNTSRIVKPVIAAATIIIFIVCGILWYFNSVGKGREAEMDRTANAFQSSNDKTTGFWGEITEKDKAYETIDEGLWGAWMSANDEGLKTFTDKADKEIANRRKALDKAGAEIRERKQLIAEMSTAADNIKTAPSLSESEAKAAAACVEAARENNRLDEELYDLKRQLADIDAATVKEFKDYLAGKNGEQDVSEALKKAVTERNNVTLKANETRASRIEATDGFSADWRTAT